MPKRADVLLLQFRCPEQVLNTLHQDVQSFVGRALIQAWQPELMRLARENQFQEAYAYIRLAAPIFLQNDDLASIAQQWKVDFPQTQSLRISRLERAFDTPGHSVGAEPCFHYVVETDPEPGWSKEMFRWYDTEHMPGLAAVPGCIHATRYLNHDHGPLSLACYDLETQSTIGSEPWLAVRSTAWSSIVRPHFTNTKRTMFQWIEKLNSIQPQPLVAARTDGK